MEVDPVSKGSNISSHHSLHHTGIIQIVDHTMVHDYQGRHRLATVFLG